MGWWRICADCLPKVYEEYSDHYLGYTTYWTEPVLVIDDINGKVTEVYYMSLRHRLRNFFSELRTNGIYKCDRCEKRKWKYFEVYDFGPMSEEDLRAEAEALARQRKKMDELRATTVPLE